MSRNTPFNSHSFFMQSQLTGECLSVKIKKELIVKEIKRYREEAFDFNIIDPKKSLAAIKRAAALGDIVSLDVLLKCYQGIKPDTKGITGEYSEEIDFQSYQGLIESNENLVFLTLEDLINSGDSIAANEIAEHYIKQENIKTALEYLKRAAFLGNSDARERIARLTGPSCPSEIFCLAISIQLEIDSLNKIFNPKIPELYNTTHIREININLPTFEPSNLYGYLTELLYEKELEASKNYGFMEGMMFTITTLSITTSISDLINKYPKNFEKLEGIRKFMKFCITNKIASPICAKIINGFKKWEIPLSSIGLKNDIDLLDQNEPENKSCSY